MSWVAAPDVSNQSPQTAAMPMRDANGTYTGPVHISLPFQAAPLPTSLQQPPRTTGSPIS